MGETEKALPPFNVNEDSRSLGASWIKWTNAYENYIKGFGVKQPAIQKFRLLFYAGSDVLEIHNSQPELEDSSGLNEYEIALAKLNKYFTPKQNKIFERHLFRQIGQAKSDKFELFLVKLRQQAGKCKFTNAEEHIVDQIVEKCYSDKLRRKILELDDTKTLNDIIHLANSLEAVEYQMLQFKEPNENESNVCAVKEVRVVHCYRCGSSNHEGKSEMCPALQRSCDKCGLMGHFARKCKTKMTNKRVYSANQSDRYQKSFKNVKKESVQSITSKPDEKKEYIFHVDVLNELRCKIGGIPVDMVIDSGCRLNIIDDKTWNALKRKQIQVYNQQRDVGRTFYGYGNKNPLEALGSFETDIQVPNGKKMRTTFYVIVGGSQCLLGRETSEQLGLLKICVDVNSISAPVKPFPKFKEVLVDISINKDVRPVIQPYRHIPIPLEVKVNKKLEELVHQDIIEKVDGHSPWISAMVPIQKKDGDVRICIDMRQANNAINREHYPLPTIENILPHLGEAKIFSRLDIKNAFHQVEISERSRYITTFITKHGLYRYKRLSFGICCAPEIFQKILEGILRECVGCINYIDDIIVFGKTQMEHDQNLDMVKKTLLLNNVQLNEDKCLYGLQSIEFLGYELSNLGVKPSKEKIESVQQFREPKSSDEVQSFLGLVNFVGCRFIPHLATTTEPLRKLLRKGCTFIWTEEHRKSFNELKEVLSNREHLGYYSAGDRTQVIADASPVGLGAVLIQFKNDVPRIIAYASKSLSDCERRYCQTEKEALALVWSVEHFNIYLYGKLFELITDHKALETIFGKPTSKTSARIERWVLRMQSYRYKVIYRSGKSNIADPLSRLCVGSTSSTFDPDEIEPIRLVAETAVPVAMTIIEIREAYEHDPTMELLRKAIETNDWESPDLKDYKAFRNEFCCSEGLILRGSKIIIPATIRQRTLELAHEGHFCMPSMKRRIRTKVWWPKIDADVEKVVSSCKGCLMTSSDNVPQPIKRREFPQSPWVDVAVDFCEITPKDHLFVMVDYYSRLIEMEIMNRTTAKDLIDVCLRIFNRFGFPVSITSDNGPQFISREFQDFMKIYNIKWFPSAEYWPQQNGEVERQNRSLVKRARISKATNTDWKAELRAYLLMYHNTPHSTTGQPPSQLFFGRLLKDKIPHIQVPYYDLEARDKDKAEKEKGKDYADRKRRARASSYEPGDKVLVKNVRKTNKLNTNFNPQEHTLVSIDGGDCLVKNDADNRVIRRNVVHLKKVNNMWQTV